MIGLQTCVQQPKRVAVLKMTNKSTTSGVLGQIETAYQFNRNMTRGNFRLTSEMFNRKNDGNPRSGSNSEAYPNRNISFG